MGTPFGPIPVGETLKKMKKLKIAIAQIRRRSGGMRGPRGNLQGGGKEDSWDLILSEESWDSAVVSSELGDLGLLNLTRRGPSAGCGRRIQSLRAFRRPKLGGLELPGFQDWTRLTCRDAAEGIISESCGFLNECYPHPESLEKHLGAARKLSKISSGSLQQLLGIFRRSFT